MTPASAHLKQLEAQPEFPSPGSNATLTGPSAFQFLIQERLDEHFGTRRVIQAIGQRRCGYTSSFPIDRLEVLLDDGSRVRLTLKDLSPESMLESARRARPQFLYDPQREINVYRSILPHAPAGTPTTYGAVADASAGRYWQLLEQVRGLPLWQVGDLAMWEQTAAWIARFHQTFSPLTAHRFATGAGALVYDAGFYWRWLTRAQQFADGDAAKRRVLDGVERVYERLVDRLTRVPQTIIHGEFFASNVLIRKRAHERVCPVDWEMTAIGPGLIDLAALAAGWNEESQRVIARAYLAATVRGNGAEMAIAPPGRLPVDFSTDLDACRLYLAVRMLGWSDRWEPPRAHAHDWLAEAERTSQRLRRLA